ncbi:MAG: hypothetical protein KDE68_12760 [Rhodocyclaceae bacterium]|nr:hypothetical protein [Rhodocyclaceae bacterium]
MLRSIMTPAAKLSSTLRTVRALVCLGVALSCPVAPALAQGVDRVERQDQDRLRRADIRASVSHFVRIEDNESRLRPSLSDDERQEMRRQIDEAIRKAYGHRQRDRSGD